MAVLWTPTIGAAATTTTSKLQIHGHFRISLWTAIHITCDKVRRILVNINNRKEFQFVRKTSGFVVRYASCAHTTQPIFHHWWFLFGFFGTLTPEHIHNQHTHKWEKETRNDAKPKPWNTYLHIFMYISSCFLYSFFFSIFICWQHAIEILVFESELVIRSSRNKRQSLLSFSVCNTIFKSVIVWFSVRDVRELQFQRSKSSKQCNIFNILLES